ncbi:hypothetical protein D8B26_004051 [Coccidioides posadasii str. Silveira]|uniref:Uncharacterized protein n=1 Tax=Coccidioides posadasii (strain RMSCC 757 / Silveira) TaxID=443226 RepID=E9DHW8_COCPS|nr:conserved hypothetical protein [Coccidioides posadasii str. Silveira]QVM09390.1 hypothetical protein D8B26_004051 [Coccidioides posadasii str. Silveira]
MTNPDQQRLTQTSLKLLEKLPEPKPELQDSYAAATVRREQFRSLHQEQGQVLLDSNGASESKSFRNTSFPSESSNPLCQTPSHGPEQLDNDLKLVQGFAKSAIEDPVERYLTPGHIADPPHVAKQGLEKLKTPYASAESIENRRLIAQLNAEGARKTPAKIKRRKSSMEVEMSCSAPDSNQVFEMTLP